MQVKQYLKRLKYLEETNVDQTTLTSLHRHHVLSIPFENLDIHLKRPINLDVPSIYQKVVLDKRGGFCYELNFLFYNLLKKLGFDCWIVSSRIYGDREILGPDFDHMSIIVALQDRWLVDVGYGDLFIEPVKIKDKHSQEDRFKTYRIDQTGTTQYLLSASTATGGFKSRYVFDDTARQIEDFHEQCAWKQYAEESHFVKNRLCTIPTSKGRITLRNDKLIRREHGLREECPVESELEFRAILKREFGVDLDKCILAPTNAPNV